MILCQNEFGGGAVLFSSRRSKQTCDSKHFKTELFPKSSNSLNFLRNLYMKFLLLLNPVL